MTTTQTVQCFYSVNDVRRANERAGMYWFEPATLRFFRSRVSDTIYGGRYFVSSEQCPGYRTIPATCPMKDVHDPGAGRCSDCTNRYAPHPRLYTVREALPNGDIETVGRFQAYRTRAQAVQAIRYLLAADAQLERIGMKRKPGTTP